MTFLASITTGAVAIARQRGVAVGRSLVEITIQAPRARADIDATRPAAVRS